MEKKKFELGEIVVTRRINDEMEHHPRFELFVYTSIAQYAKGDWGDTCDEDKQTNDEALELGERILAAYIYDEETKIWIITEWDRSYTTILFPEEY